MYSIHQHGLRDNLVHRYVQWRKRTKKKKTQKTGIFSGVGGGVGNNGGHRQMKRDASPAILAAPAKFASKL